MVHFQEMEKSWLLGTYCWCAVQLAWLSLPFLDMNNLYALLCTAWQQATQARPHTLFSDCSTVFSCRQWRWGSCWTHSHWVMAVTVCMFSPDWGNLSVPLSVYQCQWAISAFEQASDWHHIAMQTLIAVTVLSTSVESAQGERRGLAGWLLTWKRCSRC